MNPFFNTTENRPRAWIRIPVFIVFYFLSIALVSSVRLFGMEYVIAAAFSLGIFWFFFRFVDDRPNLKEAGIKVNHEWMKEFGIGSGIGLTAMSLIFLTEWILGDLAIVGFGWQNGNHDFWAGPIILFFVQMLCVGFYEELMSRGYLIPNIKEGLTFKYIHPSRATILAIVLSSTVFGLSHSFNLNVTVFAILNIIFAGLMLAIPYVLSGRLSYSIGLHFAWNFFQGGIFGFRVSGIPVRNSLINIKQGGEVFWTGGTFGPEGGLIGLVAILSISLIFLIYFKIKNGSVELNSMFKHPYKHNKEMFRKTDELA